MTKHAKDTQAAKLRGPINGLIVDYMRRNSIGTVRDFADIVGVGRSTIYDLIRGRSTVNGAWMMPSIDTLVRLAKVLNVPAHRLLYMIDPSAQGADIPMALDVAQVPVMLAGHAGAGPDQMRPLESEVYVGRDFAAGRDLVAFQVTGDSMAGGRHPIYRDDVVIVDRHVAGEINGAVVARLSGDGYVCKRLRPGNMLDSANPEFLDPEMAVIPPSRIEEVVGKVVRIIHTDL